MQTLFPEEIPEPSTESPLNISGIKLNTINAIHQEDPNSSDTSDPEEEEVNLKIRKERKRRKRLNQKKEKLELKRCLSSLAQYAKEVLMAGEPDLVKQDAY